MAGYQHPDHEGLQVSYHEGFHVPDHSGLHLVASFADHEVFHQPQPPPVAASVEPEDHQDHPKATPGKSERDTRIGGLRKHTFWLALALAVVIIVAAVVGGVRGSLAVKSASHSRCAFSTPAILNTANETANETATRIVTHTATQTATQTTTQTVTQTATQIATQTAASTPDTCPTVSNATQALMNLSVPAPSTVINLALDCPALDGKSYTSSSKEIFTQSCYHTYLAGTPAAGNEGSISDIIAIISYSIEDCMEACSSLNSLGHGPACAGVDFKITMSSVADGNCWLKNATGPGSADPMVASAKLVTA